MTDDTMLAEIGAWRNDDRLARIEKRLEALNTYGPPDDGRIYEVSELQRLITDLADDDGPWLIARVRELEAQATASASDKDILKHIAQQVASDTQWLDRTRTREADGAWDVLARELLWKSVEHRTWLLNRIREWTYVAAREVKHDRVQA